MLRNITTQTIDNYVAIRQTEPGHRRGDTVLPATVDKELRPIRAAFRKARKWKYLAEVPEFEMVRERGKLVRFVTPEHFAVIYEACDVARFPRVDGMNYSHADWWRAFFMFTYMIGWRISEPLALRRDDLDLEAGETITRSDDNKGKRDDRDSLHPVVVEHLKWIQSFDEFVFPWPHNRRQLRQKSTRIQQEAGIDLHCDGDHEHTAECHVYGFHDLRREFATMNAERLSATALQTLMRHRSFQTSQKYINMASQLRQSADGLFVLDVVNPVGIG